ncbi:hypothetical protein HAX54_014174 [Datura stramonium]|uniref:Uncharacterized protein n=1 Tax=Datura stramonium TaxID=4076 RepID=A0ABS8Y7F5_DATST|nr:hypothetical protein [Datura stramonium]
MKNNLKKENVYIEEQSNDMYEDENGVISNRKYELSWVKKETIGDLQKRKYIRQIITPGTIKWCLPKKKRKFGTMPRLQTDVSNLQHNPDQNPKSAKSFHFQLVTYSIFAEKRVQFNNYIAHNFKFNPKYLSIDNPFNNQFLFVQTILVGLQQHETIFEMPGSQGLHEPIIGNVRIIGLARHLIVDIIIFKVITTWILIRPMEQHIQVAE